MAKRITFAFLVICGFALLGGGVWLYRYHAALLADRGLDGPALLLLLSVGVMALVMPFHLRRQWAEVTALGLVREFLLRGGLVLAVLTAVFLLLGLVVLLVTLPALWGYPWLILPWLTLLVPLALALVDLYKGAFRRTPAHLGLAFLLYAWRIYGMLLIQFTFIPVAFMLFPAGFLLQILGLIDLIMGQFGSMAGDLPLLCGWANLESPACAPALWSFHLGHLLLVLLAVRYGRTLFDKSADGYALSLEWLAARLAR